MKEKHSHITKHLQTELQATIAFACYDSTEILQSGKSMRRDDIKDFLCKLYLPPNDKDDERISNVYMFLEGKGRFKAMFNIEGTSYNNIKQATKLIIPEALHCMNGKVFSIGEDCINRSILT